MLNAWPVYNFKAAVINTFILRIDHMTTCVCKRSLVEMNQQGAAIKLSSSTQLYEALNWAPTTGVLGRFIP